MAVAEARRAGRRLAPAWRRRCGRVGRRPGRPLSLPAAAAAAAAARRWWGRRGPTTAPEPSGPMSAPLSRAGPSRGPVHAAWRLEYTLRLLPHDFGRALWWGDSVRMVNKLLRTCVYVAMVRAAGSVPCAERRSGLGGARRVLLTMRARSTSIARGWGWPGARGGSTAQGIKFY